MIIANSLIEGFRVSNFIGQGIVYAQLAGSVVMAAVILGKFKELTFVKLSVRRFRHVFDTSECALDYYWERRPPRGAAGLVGIYAQACERLLRLQSPAARDQMRRSGIAVNGVGKLKAREIELIKGTCEHALDEEEIRIEHGMTMIATVVALSPMLGLLGTVWGVLDAFAEMGTAGSANLATIAPSISAALVTTVVGLLIAIPGVICFNWLTSTIRNITTDMEGFVDEFNGRITCEYQKDVKSGEDEGSEGEE